jgi:hypothetical protein
MSQSNVSRKRREKKPKAALSVWKQYRVWWSPLLAEAVLFVAAVFLTIFLYRVMWSKGSVFSVPIFVMLVLAYFGLASHNRINEFYLPRPVVFFGVGFLTLMSLTVVGVFLADAHMLGGRERMVLTFLATVPMLLFFGRCMLIFSDARCAPPITELTIKANVKHTKFRDFRRRLRFWMS